MSDLKLKEPLFLLSASMFIHVLVTPRVTMLNKSLFDQRTHICLAGRAVVLFLFLCLFFAGLVLWPR